jgi:hypothetical protein
MTECPLVPESAAVKAMGADKRYVPPASCTTMSPLMFVFIDRTEDCAWAREHGAAAVQAVPEPVGEAYRVAAVAACDTAGMPKAAATSVAAAARIEGRERPPGRRIARITIVPLAGRDDLMAEMCRTSVPHESRVTWQRQENGCAYLHDSLPASHFTWALANKASLDE